MKTPYLLGIITALLFGSFALSGILAEAGPNPNEIITVDDPITQSSPTPATLISVATCPMTHQVIGGGVKFMSFPGSGFTSFQEGIDPVGNRFVIQYIFSSGSATLQAYATCQKINFPMSGMNMIGGELLDLDTMALFVGAIGVNPVITGLVAITMGGVAAQAIWYVNSRRVKKVE